MKNDQIFLDNLTGNELEKVLDYVVKRAERRLSITRKKLGLAEEKRNANLWTRAKGIHKNG